MISSIPQKKVIRKEVPVTEHRRVTCLSAVSRHCGCDVGRSVFLQQVNVAFGPITSPDMKQTEQLVHVVVDAELIHGSVVQNDNTMPVTERRITLPHHITQAQLSYSDGHILLTNKSMQKQRVSPRKFALNNVAALFYC